MRLRNLDDYGTFQRHFQITPKQPSLARRYHNHHLSHKAHKGTCFIGIPLVHAIRSRSYPGSLTVKNLDGIGADKSLFKLKKSITVRDECIIDASLESEGKDGTYNWQQAASGTLTDGSTNFVKVVTISWGLWCC